MLLQLAFYTIVYRLYRCSNLVITIIYLLISKLDFCFSRASSHVRLSEYSTVCYDLLEFRHTCILWLYFIGIENGHTYIYHLELFEVIIALAYVLCMCIAYVHGKCENQHLQLRRNFIELEGSNNPAESLWF